MTATLKDFTLSMYLSLKSENQSISDQLLTDHLLVLRSNEKLGEVLRKFQGAKIISGNIIIIKAINVYKHPWFYTMEHMVLLAC
jgi:hypothetical protein